MAGREGQAGSGSDRVDGGDGKDIGSGRKLPDCKLVTARVRVRSFSFGAVFSDSFLIGETCITCTALPTQQHAAR